MSHPHPTPKVSDGLTPGTEVAGARVTGYHPLSGYGADTLGVYFQPVSPSLFSDPTVGAVLRELERTDPDVIAAVADVDRSQIRDMLFSTPAGRLALACRLARSLTGYRHGAR